MKSLDSIRKYHCDIPDFLKNRPRRFIQHCIRRLPPVVDMCSQQFQEKKPGVFTFRRGKCRYLIKMSGTSLKSMPTCQCADFKRFHWPCKHLLFVIRYIDGYSWNSLPEDYKNIALFNLDSTLMANSSTSTRTTNEQPTVTLTSTSPVGTEAARDVNPTDNKTAIEVLVKTALFHLSLCTEKLDNENFVTEMCNNLESLVECCRPKANVSYYSKCPRKRFRKWTRRSFAPKRSRTRRGKGCNPKKKSNVVSTDLPG